jgi:enoyl-CoA hydratase/carnithine racemase
MTDHVRFDRHDGIVDIILNRPAEGNLISQEMAEAMIGVLSSIAPDVKLIRLLAEGPDFCRGRQSPQIDRANSTPLEVRRVVAQGPLDLYAAFKKTKAPVLGVVRGQALGVGCALAGLCDVTVAAADAVFRVPEMDHGIVPTLVMWALADRIPDKAITYLVIARESISAAKAEMLGIVDVVVSPDELAAEAERLTAKITTCSATTLQTTKEFLRYARRMEPDAAMALSANLNAVVSTSKGAP